jgi:hypothetical protein
MATIFENLQKDWQYKASTGLDQKNFERLHEEFKLYYQPKAFNEIAKKAPVLTDSRQALFFILFYYKTYPTLEVLGLSFGFSDTAAFVYLDYVKPYLKRALAAQSVLVKRVFENQQAFDEAFAGVKNLFIDGSEMVIQRAQDPQKQQADFSGKKNAHAHHAADLR